MIKKMPILIVSLFLVFALFTCNDNFSPKAVLLVVGDTDLIRGDQMIEERLGRLGHIADIKVDSLTTVEDAKDKNFILISASILTDKIDDRLTDAQIPIVCLESYLYDELCMTDTTFKVEYGSVRDQTQILMIKPEHPLSAGLEDTVTVLTEKRKFLYGIPNSNAEVVATAIKDSTKALIFSYDKGDSMFGMQAPAKRVGWFAPEKTADYLNAKGWRLFDAMVNWVSES